MRNALGLRIERRSTHGQSETQQPVGTQCRQAASTHGQKQRKIVQISSSLRDGERKSGCTETAGEPAWLWRIKNDSYETESAAWRFAQECGRQQSHRLASVGHCKPLKSRLIPFHKPSFNTHAQQPLKSRPSSCQTQHAFSCSCSPEQHFLQTRAPRRTELENAILTNNKKHEFPPSMVKKAIPHAFTKQPFNARKT